jgi:O-antigen/teichoic acid export membrane protein
VILIPLYSRYLPRDAYGRVETLVAATAVLVIVLRLGVSSAFFRFYFDAEDERARVRVVRTSFWFTMASATAGLVVGLVLAQPIANLLALGDRPSLVRAAAVGLWAQMNYEQLTSLFRVEERSLAFVSASIANILITVAATVVLVVGFREGALGVIVGNFIGTLCVYLVLLAYRRYQLGLEFDRVLYKRMEAFGLPLVPSALALWAINFVDRLFLGHISGQTENGLYAVGVRISSVVVFVMIAFRTAWPAFAYSIEDDREAKRTYAYVLTYLSYMTCWLALALGLLSPWLVRLLARPYWAGSRSVALLSFAAAAYAAYTVMAIGVGRARRTQFNWIVTGAAAALNIGLNFALIPPYGQIGAAISTLAAYVLMFVGMTWNAQHVYPVPYQWRRLLSIVAVSAGLTALGKALHVPWPVALALVLGYPVALAAVGFYLPAERQRLRRVVARQA